MNTQDWSPLGWTGWISLQSKGLSKLAFHKLAGVHVLEPDSPGLKSPFNHLAVLTQG